MGYIKHKAITVTSWDKDLLEKVRSKAVELCGTRVSEVIESHVNNYRSFLVAPDGSKEGWKTSDEGDKSEVELISYIDEQAYEDGSNAVDYIYYFYGEDNGEAQILSHN